MQKILKIKNVDKSNFDDLCRAYERSLKYWNLITNLISTRAVDNLLTDLIRQSIAPLNTIPVPYEARVLDIGSGAGIPALPLKFMRQDFQLVLLEPRRKKSLFLRRLVSDLSLSQTEVICARLEGVRDRPDWQAAFDLITTRGTGSSLDLLPQMLPLLRPGGMCWFYKGRAAKSEFNELQHSSIGVVRLLELEPGFYLIIIQG